jgi:hypothetical protein
MKRLICFAAALTAFSIVLASARTLFAGVVMAETSTATGPAGKTSQTSTVYVQGDKQKVERQGSDSIIDLNKSAIYIIDKDKKSYAELPLRALKSSKPADSQDGAIQLNRTGKERVIANHSCSEYRGVAANALERVTVNACVSSNVPGGNEMTAFERNMLSRLKGGQAGRSPQNDSAAVILERQSIVSVRVPDLSGRKTYRTASLSAKNRVDDIHLKPLPADTFELPKGFTKLQNPSGPNTPPVSPNVPEEVIQAINPSLPHNSASAPF